jgi:hypothetical protein
MFDINYDTMAIEMHRGDTGAFKVRATKTSGDSWSEDDRMIFTVSGADGTIKIKRIYRLDTDRTETALGDGVVQIEFHNDDTDTWPNGLYTTELRFIGDAVWTGTELMSDCIDDLLATSHIIEGVPVRTAIQSTLNIKNIIGEV